MAFAFCNDLLEPIGKSGRRSARLRGRFERLHDAASWPCRGSMTLAPQALGGDAIKRNL